MAGKLYGCTFIQGEAEFIIDIERIPQIGESFRFLVYDEVKLEGKVVKVSTTVERPSKRNLSDEIFIVQAEHYRITLENEGDFLP